MDLRVFLVEDLFGLVALLDELFKALGGLRVMGTASTEAEAKLWLAENEGSWDVAIVDLVLDEGAGFEVIRQAKQQPRAGKVVVFSSFATPGIRAHCFALGADAVFDKGETEPFVTWLDEQMQLASGRAPL